MPPVLGKEIHETSIVFDFKYMSLILSLFLTEKGLYFLDCRENGKETVENGTILLNGE